jgi:ribulose-phosphate 3-epimerase
MNKLLGQRLVAPSILSADFSRLGDEIATVMDAGARLIHVDVMDGRFVPNISIGLPIVEAVAPIVHGGGGALDVHLMIVEPERYIARFAGAGADVVTVHVEACRHLHRTLAQIREAGAAAGVALNPATPGSALDEAGAWCDLVLVMSVNPGFSGQTFIPESMAKVRAVRALLPDEAAVEVDGGIGPANASDLVAAGANLLVAGSSVFGDGDAAARFRALSAATRG